MAFTWAVFFKLLSGECQLDSAAMIIGLTATWHGTHGRHYFERTVSKRQWLGLIIGLLGLYLVLFERLDLSSDVAFDGFSIWAVFAVIASLFGISSRSGLSEALLQ